MSVETFTGDGSCGLADELWDGIFAWLDSASVARAGAVCRRWYRLSRDPDLWTDLRLSRLRSGQKLLMLFHPSRAHLTKHARSLALHKAIGDGFYISISMELHKAIMDACPLLVELTLDGLHVPHPSDLGSRGAQLLRLKRLTFRNGPSGYFVVADIGVRAEDVEAVSLEGTGFSASSGGWGAVMELTKLKQLRLVSEPRLAKADLLRIPVELGRSLRSLTLLACQTGPVWQTTMLHLLAKHCKRLEQLGISLCPARPPSASSSDPPHHLSETEVESLGMGRLRSLTLHSPRLVEAHVEGVVEALGPLAASPTLRKVLVLGFKSLPPSSVPLSPSLALHFRPAQRFWPAP